MRAAPKKPFSPYIPVPRFDLLPDDALVEDPTAADRLTTFFRRTMHSISDGVTLQLPRIPRAIMKRAPLLPVNEVVAIPEHAMLRTPPPRELPSRWMIASVGFGLTLVVFLAIGSRPAPAPPNTSTPVGAAAPPHAEPVATPAPVTSEAVSFDQAVSIRALPKARPHHRAHAAAAARPAKRTDPGAKQRSIEDALADEQLRAAER